MFYDPTKEPKQKTEAIRAIRAAADHFEKVLAEHVPGAWPVTHDRIRNARNDALAVVVGSAMPVSNIPANL